MNSLQRIKRAGGGPIVPRAVRAEIVNRARITYHVAEEESTYTAKQKSKICPGVAPPDLPHQGVGVTGGEGRGREERTDDVTDGGKDQTWII